MRTPARRRDGFLSLAPAAGPPNPCQDPDGTQRAVLVMTQVQDSRYRARCVSLLASSGFGAGAAMLRAMLRM
jgi:hypothetical protein